MNKFLCIGRLARDPEIRITAAGKKVAHGVVAIDRRFSKEQAADFISFTAFDKLAEFLEKYTKKGTKLAITGRIQTGSYEKDGRKVYTTDIIVEELEFCERKQDAEQASEKPADDDGFVVPDDLDVPFA